MVACGDWHIHGMKMMKRLREGVKPSRSALVLGCGAILGIVVAPV